MRVYASLLVKKDVGLTQSNLDRIFLFTFQKCSLQVREMCRPIGGVELHLLSSKEF
jgi:hypothetical protein